MTAWERFSQENPAVADIVLSLGDVFAGRDHSREASDYEELGMSVRAASIAAEEGTAPNGVYGTGVWVQGTRAVPAVFVQPGLAAPLGSPAARAQVRYVLPSRQRNQLRGVLAVPLDPPVEFTAPIGPGTAIKVGSNHAMLGIAATLGSTKGILTAGHAGVAGNIARDVNGDVVGKIVTSLSRSTCPNQGPTADIAFINPGRRNLVPKWAHASISPAKERETVTVWTKSGPVKTWVQGIMPQMIFTPDTASWGEVILTGTAVTTLGDSGAPVENDDGAVVGHIVGGTPLTYSVIQDVEYQLQQLGAQPA